MKRIALFVLLVMLSLGAHAEAPDLANWSPGVQLKWHLFAADESGAYFWGSANTRLGFVISIKKLKYNLAGNRVGEIVLTDFRVDCNATDVVYSIGVVTVDPVSLQYTSQMRSPDIFGTPMRLDPSWIASKAIVEGCAK